MSHSHLSLILAGKRAVSKQKAVQLLRSLEIDEQEITNLSKTDPVFDLVSMDHHAFRSEWHHAAILCILETKKGNLSIKQIAQSLGMQEIQVRTALTRLKRLGLIAFRQGKWVRDKLAKQLEMEIPSQEFPKYLRKMMQRGMDAVDAHREHEERFTASIVTVQKDQIPELLQLIDRFKDTCIKQTQKSKSPTDVYALNIQFFLLHR